MLQDCRNKVLCDYLKQAAGFAKASTILFYVIKIKYLEKFYVRSLRKSKLKFLKSWMSLGNDISVSGN